MGQMHGGLWEYQFAIWSGRKTAGRQCQCDGSYGRGQHRGPWVHTQMPRPHVGESRGAPGKSDLSSEAGVMRGEAGGVSRARSVDSDPCYGVWQWEV